MVTKDGASFMVHPMVQDVLWSRIPEERRGDWFGLFSRLGIDFLQHSSVATRLNTLALMLQATNCFAEAETLIRRALQIDENFFGPQHPKAARDLNHLAESLKDTNRLSEAEPLMRRALQI